MWPFSSKYSILDSGVLDGITDWHCHILPRVDDGVQTTEHALEILSFYEETGIRDVWLTPHIMEDCPNEPAKLKELFVAFQAAYKGPIMLHLAAENMIDTLFDQRFKEGDIMPIGEGMLLVETSYYNPPMAFESTLKEIKEKGYKPLLAHPERYVYMTEKDYPRLKENGILFQLNIMSLVGMYGQHAARTASRLLQEGLYDYAGSDLHRLTPWRHAIQDKVLTKKEIDAIWRLLK